MGDNARPSIPVLQKQLLEMEGGMFFSTNTTSDALPNAGKSAISMSQVVALCRLWHLDISDVLAEAFAEYEIQPAFGTIVHGARYLTNPGYIHKFYGYLYPSNELAEFARYFMQGPEAIDFLNSSLLAGESFLKLHRYRYPIQTPTDHSKKDFRLFSVGIALFKTFGGCGIDHRYMKTAGVLRTCRDAGRAWIPAR